MLRPEKKPGIALYTRCEDELLCGAELLVLLERVKQDRPEEQMISGYYDVDPTFPIAEFKRGYRGRAGDLKWLMARRSGILAEG